MSVKTKLGHCCLCVVIALSFSGVGLSQNFSTFDQVDYVTVQDFSIFQSIWDKADSENTRIALIGDSQETSPGGAGAIYIPSLNYQFYKHFGKVGETFVAPGFESYGGGSPAAEWLLQGSPGSLNGNMLGNLPTNQILPGARTRIYDSSAYGQNSFLGTSNLNVNAGALLPETHLWSNQDNVTATIFGVTSPGSDEFSWRASPTNGGLSFFLGNSASGTTSIGLDAPAGSIISQDIGTLPFDGYANQQLLIKGSGSFGAELAGARFTNLSTPGGVSIQDFAAGGYLTRSFLDNHSEAGEMLRAFGEWDAILIHTGANDAFSGNGRSALVFQQDVADLIAAIRSPEWLDNPEQKFILVTDPYRHNGSEQKTGQYDQYAGALAGLALDDPFIMAVNSRRLTGELGWNEDNPTQYLSDVVHYTSEGARLLAAVEAELIINGGPVLTLGDCNKDRVVDFSDIAVFISILSAGDYLAEADTDQNSVVDFSDIVAFISILSAS